MSSHEVENQLFTAKEQRKIDRLAEKLRSIDGEAEIILLGIGHIGEPGKDLLEMIKDADVVTLELTRNVVNASIRSQEEIEVLSKNDFWKGVLAGLRDFVPEKTIKGIEVQQTARHAWRRYFLHVGKSPFMSRALITIEVTDEGMLELSRYLSEEEKRNLIKFNWLNETELMQADNIFSMIEARIMTIKQEGKEVTLPLTLGKGLQLISVNANRAEENQPPILFMKIPDSSLLETRGKLLNMVTALPIELDERETTMMADEAISQFLLSPAVLKDAQEILYFLYQRAQKVLPERNRIKVLHIGGAHHTRAIKQILESQLGDYSDVIKLTEKYDSRFPQPMNGRSVAELLGDYANIKELLYGVKISGFEASLDSDYVVSVTKKAVNENWDEFIRRLKINRLLGLISWDNSFEACQRLVRLTNFLYCCDMKKLQWLQENPEQWINSVG